MSGNEGGSFSLFSPPLFLKKCIFLINVLYFVCFRLFLNVGSEIPDHMRSALQDYREKQRQRFLQQKSKNKTESVRTSCYQTLGTFRKNNTKEDSSNTKGQVYLERDKPVKLGNEDITELNNGNFQESQYKTKSESFRQIHSEHNLDNGKISRSPDEIYNEKLINDETNVVIDTIGHSPESRNSHLLSQQRDSHQNSSNSKKFGSGFFNSIKAWASSVISGHSPQTGARSRFSRSSRNSSRQQRSNNTMSDEELARRIQIEEFNAANMVPEQSQLIHVPTPHSFGLFHNEMASPRTFISSSSAVPMSIAPFQGSPYYNVDYSSHSSDNDIEEVEKAATTNNKGDANLTESLGSFTKQTNSILEDTESEEAQLKIAIQRSLVEK
ncbi:hypothetical protein cand_019660 [Cryptosporidium andersoni]|uniref:Uncharacterized protein n=1 Tax=Cryptosporidium andersoni TaxID=117008 RepID=A0A1J4MSV4_9CRYT|nr:hypothetical protein cand_019660 [Cryptosporidium andersoni]